MSYNNYTNFRDPAKSIVENFVKTLVGKPPPEKVYGKPKYVGLQTFREPGMNKTYWVVLWRQGGINPLTGWRDTLQKELEDLVEKGKFGGTEEICDALWRLETLDRAPDFRRSEYL
ncbi:uncharacterized protein PAC_15581 [Phialocephala subalpina]|uniref:Uncharacterized protein n=1 Tax=Phialocephala subalpina TaxID=576137 RepID=A0A1L7XKU0_9HELO|nr:uncharacterized protein PAC_15581 [Phialocephala subalpina]